MKPNFIEPINPLCDFVADSVLFLSAPNPNPNLVKPLSPLVAALRREASNALILFKRLSTSFIVIFKDLRT